MYYINFKKKFDNWWNVRKLLMILKKIWKGSRIYLLVGEVIKKRMLLNVRGSDDYECDIWWLMMILGFIE